MPRARLALLLLASVAALAPAAAPPKRSQWIAVVAPAFRDAIAPLVEHRRTEGMKVVVLTTTDVLSERDIRNGQAERLRDRVRQLCRQHVGPSHVLLVGAVRGAFFGQTETTVVPPLRGTISRMKDQPTDVSYGCRDGTRVPSVAVGRFPARSVAEVKAMVSKTLALEKGSTRPGTWKRRLTVLAGIPAYNAVVDRLVESIAFARFDRIHPAWTGRAIYTNPQSRFCLPDRQLRSQALDYLKDGQAVVLYLGHSNASGLYAGPTAAFLDRNDWAKLHIGSPGCVFFTFGCNGCQLAGIDGEGYGVWAMRNPHGPAAVLGSHGICFAAMVQLACDGLFREAFEKRPAHRVGDCWLAALRGVATGKIDFISYRMLDTVDGDSRIPQATQRQEHLEMFVLLGDPALRLPQVADDITVRPDSRSITPGQTLLVQGKLPARLHRAKVEVRLDRTPGSAPVEIAPLPAKAGAARDKVMLANHRLANDFTITRTEMTPVKGAFTARLKLPGKLPWPRVILRVHAVTADDEALWVEILNVPNRKDGKSP